MVLHELRNFLQEKPKTAKTPAVQDNGLPERGVAVLHQHHPLIVSVMMNVAVVAQMSHRGLLRPGRPPEDILVWMMVVIWCVRVIQRCGLSLQRFQGLGMSVLGAKVAFLQWFVMSHHAMLGDPGEPAGVVLAITTYGVEALEVAFVGGHCGWSSPCSG